MEFDVPNGDELIGNHIEATYSCVISSSEGIVARDNVLLGGAGPVFDLYADGVTHVFENNHIIRGTGLAVEIVGDAYAPDDYHIDMTGNWWGTDDPALIAEWIHDGNDVDDWRLKTVVDFEPFLSEPVSAEATPLGGVKALFR